MSRFIRKDGEIVGSNAMCVPLQYNSVRRSKRDIKDDHLIIKKMSSLKENSLNDAEILNDNITFSNVTEDQIKPTNPSTDHKLPNNITPPTRRHFIPKYAELIGTRKYIPCAICNGEKKVSKVMMPSHSKCPLSWDVEYTGYLMSYHHGTSQSEVICVNDQALGVSPSSDPIIRELISAYMAPIKKDCNSFRCPRSNQELIKCALCTKKVK